MENRDAMKPLLTKDGYTLFLIDADSSDEHKMEFKVYEVQSWQLNDDKTPGDLELYVTGIIKWDGCSHVWFGEEEEGRQDGYLHLCGKSYWANHSAMMLALYELAENTIKKYDADAAR